MSQHINRSFGQSCTSSRSEKRKESIYMCAYTHILIYTHAHTTKERNEGGKEKKKGTGREGIEEKKGWKGIKYYVKKTVKEPS